MPREENGDLEDECWAADNETRDGEISLEEYLNHPVLC